MSSNPKPTVESDKNPYADPLASATTSIISHLGTFDVENYGDLLYPIIFRRLLQQRYAGPRILQYALLPGEAPQEVGFENYAVRSLFAAERAEPVKLVVGGGDILRTDWNLVAMHYGRKSRMSYGGLRRSIGLTGRLGYWLRRYLPPLKVNTFYANRFRTRWMNYPAAGPFLINPQDLPRGSVVSYVSCGVPHDFAPSESETVKRTLDQSLSVYLRDEQSAEKLRQAGVHRKIHIAPDLAVILSDQFRYADEARKGRQILSRFGVKTDGPILCFQSQPYPGFLVEDIARQLKRYRERAGSDVVLVPTGYCHGDHEFLQSLSKQSGGAFKYADVHSVYDVISVIAACDIFVGTSLHGNITAFSFGIPHLFGPLPVDKAAGFLRVTNLPLELKLGSWSEINDRIDMAVGMGRSFFSERAQTAKARVYKVIDEVLAELLK